ncbi:serine/threonine-protein kinase Haspin homolog ALK2 isoform X2 [Contarinia nasturtii]|uniref:serine/threonine-protein kinase Haspin homolog ALK2 isoform X2 n=1 Tax=Contarinia nasturtii TaxID=265458 RepID=UPI0012D43463|nr:serine/threonine-protein kinase Haspin homolog ALK2 isoform X2 [Contarinia nasturtii]
MVRKYGNKTKQKSQPAKSTRTKKGKKVSNVASPQTISSSSDLDYTLPEGNHLDSFDLFRLNQVHTLKEKKVLKKDVRASFNRDSSIDADSDDSSMQVSIQVSTVEESIDSEDEENVDPRNSEESLPLQESINSWNSFRFSANTRARRQQEKARLKELQPKRPPTNYLNLKPAFHVSPLDKYLRPHLTPQFTHTSTPEKFFSEANLSSIHNATDESAVKLPENEKPNISQAETTKPSFIHPAVFVAHRRPKPMPGRHLTFSSVERTQMEKNDDEMMDNSTASTSIVSVMDMSSILGCEHEENAQLSDESVDNASSINELNTSHTNNKTEDNIEKTKNSKQFISNQLTNINISAAIVANDSLSSFESNVENDMASKSLLNQCHNDVSSDAVISVSSSSTTNSPTTTIAKVSIKPRVGFDASNSIHELSMVSEQNISSQKIVMKGGKWRRTIFEARRNKVTQSPRRTLERKSEPKSRESHIRPSQGNILRRRSIFIKDIPDRKTINSQVQRKSHQTVTVLDESDVESIYSADFSPKSTPINVLSKLRSSRLQPIADSVDLKHYQQSAFNTGSQLSICDSSSIESVLNELEKSTASLHLGFNSDELKHQLLNRCNQIDVLPFDEIYSASVLKECRKIGEGVFGEVFLNETSSRSSYVLKIIPIEGNEEINGAQQKRFDEILQEVIISQELSALRNGNLNRSSGFVEVLNVRLIEGRYPAHLIDLWNDFDTLRVSENDCPDVFGDDQLYVVFELANCGSDLEAHIFKNSEQSFSAFKQVALSLAVAESQFEFEHRDLHWGNVLVQPTAEKSLTFHLNGRSIEVRTHGIKATIIDYTLSRLVYKTCCLYQDLAADPELFDTTGDYQFDIYRLMRTRIQNYWEIFDPYTNVLWLHYMVDKLIGGVNYTAKRAAKHRQFIDELMKLRDQLLNYRSATDYIETHNQ